MPELFCESCLNSYDVGGIRKYQILYENIKLHEQDEVSLCYVCSRIAKLAQKLINNIQNKPVPGQANPLNHSIKSLSTLSLSSTEITGIENLNTDIQYTVMSVVNGQQDVQFCKKYVKNEGMPEEINEPYMEIAIKQEDISDDDSYPLQELLIGEVIDEVKAEKPSRNRKKCKVKKKKKIRYEQVEDVKKEDSAIEIHKTKVYLTLEEFRQENIEKANDKKYLNTQFKCTDCVLGFNYKLSYIKHMKTHSETAGKYICDLCKQRFKEKKTLTSHLRTHRIRYKCLHCNLLRNQSSTIQQHLQSAHMIGNTKFECIKCNKHFGSGVTLRQHNKRKHCPRKRLPCVYCNKTYISSDTLKNHIMLLHTTEVAAVKKEKTHICMECGAAFRTASFLKTHQLKHSDRRDFYCVECDKSFKCETALKRHLSTTTPHINYVDLPLACAQCDKKFSVRRDLDRHMNRIHLNIKPYKCDLCPKAYINSWSLGEHKKLTHEGYKRPLIFQCEFCDKAFGRQHILRAHIRTHTGERPYQCTKCQASFSQAGILNTHNKLVHLRLTRDGKRK